MAGSHGILTQDPVDPSPDPPQSTPASIDNALKSNQAPSLPIPNLSGLEAAISAPSHLSLSLDPFLQELCQLPGGGLTVGVPYVRQHVLDILENPFIYIQDRNTGLSPMERLLSKQDREGSSVYDFVRLTEKEEGKKWRMILKS